MRRYASLGVTILGLALVNGLMGCQDATHLTRVPRIVQVETTRQGLSSPADHGRTGRTAPPKLAVSNPVEPASHQFSSDGGEQSDRPDAASGGRQESLDLESLESLARQNNPTLVQAGAHVDAAYAKAFQAGLYPNPRIGYAGEQFGVEGTAGEFQGGFVSQEIVTAGKLQLSREKFRARASVAEFQAVAQQLRVLNDVRIHFYRTLGAEAVVDVHQELLETAEDNLLTTREMLNVGQASAADLHLATASLEQARLELKMAENDYRAAWHMLTSVVGIDVEPAPLSGSLEGDTTPIGWEAALERLMAESPELDMARAKLRSDELTVERERAEPIPNLVLQGAVGKNLEADDTVASAELAIELPLFDRNQGTIRQAENDLLRAHEELRRTELALRRRLAEQYRHYLTALQHVQELERTIVPEARKAYAARLKGYQENRESWPNVLDAQRHFFQRRVEYIRNLVAWRAADVAVRGLLLVDGLAAPEGPTPPGHIDAVPKPR